MKPSDNRLRRALTVHRRQLATCTRCDSRHPGARPIISGAAFPRVMLVGQAPGKTEIEERRPFAGRAGRTLFRWLEHVGLDEAAAREAVYIAAVTRCYPGAHPSGRGDRVPSRKEQEACADWLQAELQIIQPRVLIPVGRLAIERFLPRLPLARLVGTEHAVTHAGGNSVAIPLPHPSGASSWIHAPGHRGLVERALALIRKHLLELGLVAAMLLAQVSDVGAQERDTWFGPDKVKHFFLSGFAYTAGHGTLSLVRARSDLVEPLALSGAVVLGLGKELSDRRRGHRISMRDLLWNAAGTGAAFVLMRRTRG